MEANDSNMTSYPTSSNYMTTTTNPSAIRISTNAIPSSANNSVRNNNVKKPYNQTRHLISAINENLEIIQSNIDDIEESANNITKINMSDLDITNQSFLRNGRRSSEKKISFDNNNY
jgi:hypothetical protein